MSDEPPPPSRRDFDARLREAKARRRARKGDTDQPSGGGLAFAMRVGVEVVAALGVGVGIGLLLDRWLGTGPWMLLLFFVLGAAAGMLNIYRIMSGYGYTAGYRPKRHGPGKPDEPKRKS